MPPDVTISKNLAYVDLTPRGRNAHRAGRYIALSDLRVFVAELRDPRVPQPLQQLDEALERLSREPQS